MMYVFVALVEVRPKLGCELLDPKEINGAIVRCYIPASDETAARALLADYLATSDLELVEIEWLVRRDEVEWENPDDPSARELTSLALQTQAVEVGEFHCWGHDAPDVLPN